MNRKSKALYIAQAGSAAALYVALTMLSSLLGIASGAVQVRLSEALCILPCFTSAAVPGLYIGCLLANLLTGCAPWDIVFGSLATLIGAVGTRLLKDHRYLAPIPPIAANMVIVPLILRFVYGETSAVWFLMLTVGAGEVISCGILGEALYSALKKRGVMKED